MTKRNPSVVITGGSGRLAHSAIPLLESRGWEVSAVSRDELDITKVDRVVALFRQMRPDVVLNLAAWTDADTAESQPDGAYAVNVQGVANVVEGCSAVNAHLCHLSSDYVFDGEKSGPYVESDVARPLSEYVRTKLAGEAAAGDSATVVRTAWVSGENGRSIVRSILHQAAVPGAELQFVDDQRGSPTYAGDLSDTLEQLICRRAAGLFHVTNQGTASWYELACFVMEAIGEDPNRVRPIRTHELNPQRPAPRPRNSVLSNQGLRDAGLPPLPEWRESFARLAKSPEMRPLTATPSERA